MSGIRANLEEIRNRIDRAARKAGRDPERVRLVAVSKKVSVELLREAMDYGQHLFGENYLQEAEVKIAELGSGCEWHFIGHLQSNKATQAAGLFDLIETVDRLKVATALDRSLSGSGRVLPVLLQVNIGREPQKSGVLPEAAAGLLRQLQELPNLLVRGLMVMPPFLAEAEAVRPFFRSTRELAAKLSEQGLLPPTGEVELSMGMSGDYQVAVAEGATLVRVGTALFGARG
ncbi:MAG: YggS family pyridoxal phosphate-dependent enzyme [Desulfobulbaceae bacterium]|nr:YggS family pyridoxal phosphate-dependent enzyme [Desulfobulbaceae bacterium]